MVVAAVVVVTVAAGLGDAVQDGTEDFGSCPLHAEECALNGANGGPSSLKDEENGMGLGEDVKGIRHGVDGGGVQKNEVELFDRFIQHLLERGRVQQLSRIDGPWAGRNDKKVIKGGLERKFVKGGLPGEIIRGTRLIQGDVECHAHGRAAKVEVDDDCFASLLSQGDGEVR